MQMDNIDDDTTGTDRLVGGGGGGDLGTEPNDRELMEYYNGKYRVTKYGKNEYYHVNTMIAGVMTSLLIVLPVASLAIGPGALNGIKNGLDSKKNDELPSGGDEPSAGGGSQSFNEETQHTLDVAAITSSRKVWN